MVRYAEPRLNIPVDRCYKLTDGEIINYSLVFFIKRLPADTLSLASLNLHR